MALEIETAHQYKIRLEKKMVENLEFDHKLCDLTNTEIKLIDKQTAKNIIVEYEWLGTIPLITRYHFGIYFNVNGKQHLGGVLIFSDDYAQNTGVWDKFGFEDKLILLSRGVCLWWTPKNTASYFISRACKWLKQNTKYRIVTATVDPAAGEIGTIYQSLNWNYVGLMSGNYNSNKETKRFSVLINGKLRYSRSIRKELGTMKKDVILAKYPDAKFIPQYRKRRYFHFMDTKYQNKIYTSNISHLLQPFPKRNIKCAGLIYLITNTVNNKIYIGQTTRSLVERISDYERGICNPHIKNAINKYGFDKFKFKIIDTAENLNELNLKEIDYILQYNSRNKEIGYNIEFGGKNSIPDESTRNKMSKSHKGIKQSNEWINNRVANKGSKEALKYGRPKTDEEKRHLSEISPKYWSGKSRSEETKQKIRETRLKSGLAEKHKQLFSKKVIAYNPHTNEVLNTFESSTDAAKYYGNISQSTISRRCTGKSKNKGEIYFKYD